ncbi:hypothetical protein ACA910_005665 [Epithemia clementina (nom. ined.)]
MAGNRRRLSRARLPVEPLVLVIQVLLYLSLAATPCGSFVVVQQRVEHTIVHHINHCPHKLIKATLPRTISVVVVAVLSDEREPLPEDDISRLSGDGEDNSGEQGSLATQFSPFQSIAGGLSRRNLLATFLASAQAFWCTVGGPNKAKAETLSLSFPTSSTSDVRPSLAQWLEQKQRPKSVLPTSSSSSSSVYVVRPRMRNVTTTNTYLKNQAAALQELSRERSLLKLLPIRNDRKSVFRALQGRLEGISFALEEGRRLPSSIKDAEKAESDKEYSSLSASSSLPTATWTRIRISMNETIAFLDRQRDQLSPVFNQEDSTALAIRKAEQGELRIENLRSLLVDLRDACASAAGSSKNFTQTGSMYDIDDGSNDLIVGVIQRLQRLALLALAEVGELLVATFPYDVPSEGKFSYLPRLLGRARVTFSFRRNKNNNNLLPNFNDNNSDDNIISSSKSSKNNKNKRGFLGNITIIADGFLAPITAGNFVDLSVRNFYTGLPVKIVKKRLLQTSNTNGDGGGGGGFTTPSLVGPSSLAFVETVDVPVLGSFNEGFYDPLTAKLRRIPLEMIRVENANNVPSLSYSLQAASGGGVGVGSGLAILDLSSKLDDTTNMVLDLETEPTSSSKPLLSFSDIPGLVAWNHPDKYPNSGSSEFFSLQSNSMPADRRKLLDGKYAPFGYIVQGLDLLDQLQPNDVISDTFVDEWGELNLVKIRTSRFSDIVSQPEMSEEDEEGSEG